MKANKGEWSEFYAFLKILEKKKIPAADSDLKIIADKFFIFKKIIREETGQNLKIFDLRDNEVYILDSNEKILKVVSDKNLGNKTLKIFNKIKSAKVGTFKLPEAESLMKKYLCTQIKADSSKKADINGVIYDRVSNKEELLGFSVKSMAGSASTLLNAGKTTNFIYEVKKLDKKYIKKINSITTRSKIQDRMKAILKRGGKLDFNKVSKKEFDINLKKIDTVLPIFVAKMLEYFFLGEASKLVSLTRLLSKDKKLKNLFKLSKSDYEYKMKNFLAAVALGMIPSKEWDGFTKAHGGYIIVKDDGNIICYHLYNRDEFLTYLYKNTKFESASSSRHDYGKLYEENGKIYFNLNLQIRFLK